MEPKTLRHTIGAITPRGRACRLIPHAQRFPLLGSHNVRQISHKCRDRKITGEWRKFATGDCEYGQFKVPDRRFSHYFPSIWEGDRFAPTCVRHQPPPRFSQSFERSPLGGEHRFSGVGIALVS